MMQNQKEVYEPLIGQYLRSVEKKDHTWFFKFADDITITTESSWRFMDMERIIVTSEDHGHQFGLPAPVDAAEMVLTRVTEQKVKDVSVSKPTGDLSIEFKQQLHLQFLQMSSGYESWSLQVYGSQVICLGGGDIEYFPKPGA